MDNYTRNSLECSKLTTNNFNADFSRGISLLAEEYRDAVYAIYGFVRLADEIGEKFEGQDRKDLIAGFQKDTFEAIEKEFSSNPILHSFQWAVNKSGIDHKQIRSYLRSLRLGLCPNSQSNFNNDVYIKYIYGSTELISQMCLKIFSRNEGEYLELSPAATKLAEAIQKINFLRDTVKKKNEEGLFTLPDASYVTFDLEMKRAIEKDIEWNLDEAARDLMQLPDGVTKAVKELSSHYRKLFIKVRDK